MDSEKGKGLAQTSLSTNLVVIRKTIVQWLEEVKGSFKYRFSYDNANLCIFICRRGNEPVQRKQ